MKTHIFEGDSAGTGPVTREMVHALVAERAFREGRPARAATMSDFARAKRELTGEPEMEYGSGGF
jgi:hypothetical protein